MYERAKILPAGDSNVVLELGNEISVAVHKKVRAFFLALNKEPVKGVTEIIPTYRSLLINYDPVKISYRELKRSLLELEERLEAIELPSPQTVVIPTLYGGEAGPDLEDVASYNNLSPEEVIEIHSGTDYLIYMLGFTPGFPYLGGMSEKIATPRLENPRTVIPGGSVGIAGSQTGIYPIDSPGGWRLIGRTPVELYNPHANPPVLLQVGDYLRFKPITKEEYVRIVQQVSAGNYSVTTIGTEDD